MSVVLRCPTCGTTQAHTGECEACSEGDVRYFCTNHDEGIWLDGPVCSRCGRKFGEASRTAPALPTPSVPTPPTRAPDFRPPRRRRPPEPPDVDFGIAPPTRSRRELPAEPEVLPRTPSLGELLEEFTKKRARADGRSDEAEEPPAEPRTRPGGFPVGGCLVRIVGVVFLLIAAAILLLLMLFGGFTI